MGDVRTGTKKKRSEEGSLPHTPTDKEGVILHDSSSSPAILALLSDYIQLLSST